MLWSESPYSNYVKKKKKKKIASSESFDKFLEELTMAEFLIVRSHNLKFSAPPLTFSVYNFTKTLLQFVSIRLWPQQSMPSSHKAPIMLVVSLFMALVMTAAGNYLREADITWGGPRA